MGSSSKDKKDKSSSSKDKKDKKDRSSSKDKSSKDTPDAGGSGGSGSSGSVSCDAATAATAAAAAAGVAAGLAAASAAQAQRAQAEAAVAAAARPPPVRPSYAGYGGAGLGGGLGLSRQGYESLYADYRRCMESLERAINGELTAKRSALAEAARRVEANMEEVNHAAALVRDETESQHAGVSERLEGAARVKLAVLGQQLSALALDLEAIDGFISDVAATAAGAAPPAGIASPAPAGIAAPAGQSVTWAASTAADSAAASALALLQRQPELMSRASRLAAKPVATPVHVAADDLPREEAERNAKLQRAEVRRVCGKCLECGGALGEGEERLLATPVRRTRRGGKDERG
jgi:hypothetical protein